MRRLDRYVTVYFLQAYFYCIAGFLSIWFIFDVSDNISTFLDQRISRMLILKYYLTQIPQILVILLPVALLLALLFSLGRMSRSNEIVSMLTAGVSLPRILAPLLFVAFLSTVGSTAMNYSLAPHGEYAHKRLLEDPASRRQQFGLTAQIFRNRTDNRTWYIGQFFPGNTKFNTVHIVQQDANDHITTAYIATTAFYHADTHTWELESTKVVHYDQVGNIVNVEYHVGTPLLITDWSETPFRLSSANVRAEHLSVPELRDYLQFNSDFPATLLAPFATHLQYRIALPWTCAVVALIAGSLGVGYSRRGILSSVAAAVLLVFAMNFVMHLFLALGEGARVPTWVAAWTPNVIFGVIGLILLYYRATNREPPLSFLRPSSVIAK
ncbi:MAG TPA: LptF/LptG family permease [Chthoniobacterales bacterium]|nr:LptF/LptG family permease [Chthoniobacterales bacterium]